ncbi:CD5 antigen-like [Oncorhynchus nerka]|uniref:CD5 antigen-like n=1 Tax=Oncorhynchus nerka TaxID=8023 RepID=UPI0031B890EB
MKMQKSVSVVPLLLLLCLCGLGVTKGQGVEVTKAVDFKTEFEVKTPADGKADGQTDLWAELRDMVVEQRVEKREAVTQSQLEDSKTQNSDLQNQSVSPPAEYSVRLVNGTTSCSGTVEVFYEGEWLSKCYGWWSMMKEVKMLCKELNCGNVVAESRGPQFETGRGIVTIYSMCSGDESSIGQCVITGARTVCNRGYYHHVTCSESVRLVDGSGLCSGRVEVKSNQSWASVCEADFDRQDAEVVCRELGCGAPTALQGGLYGEGEGQTWDKEFQCKGNESLLLDCDTSDRKNNTCLPGYAVGLTCSEPDDVRLVGGGSRCAGRVEWYYQGEWRTVGSFGGRYTSAVVCRQLGCGSTVSVLPGNTTRGFRVDCEGDESALRGCIRSHRLLPGFTVICSDLFVQPDIFLTDSMGGVFRGPGCSGATASTSLAPLSHSTQEAPSSSRSPAPTEPRSSQLSITLLPSSSLLQMTPTKGTTAVFMTIMFSLITSPLRVSSSPSPSQPLLCQPSSSDTL